MGVRETLNKSKPLSFAIAGGGIAIAAVIYFVTNRPASSLSTAFFSVDDGKTYFKDEVRKAAPFDHEGKQAVRAYLYDVNGTPTVRFLERFKANVLPQATDLLSKNDGTIQTVAPIDQFCQGDVLEVKKPGDEKWVSARSGAGENIRVHAGDGAKPIFQ